MREPGHRKRHKSASRLPSIAACSWVLLILLASGVPVAAENARESIQPPVGEEGGDLIEPRVYRSPTGEDPSISCSGTYSVPWGTLDSDSARILRTTSQNFARLTESVRYDYVCIGTIPLEVVGHGGAYRHVGIRGYQMDSHGVSGMTLAGTESEDPVDAHCTYLVGSCRFETTLSVSVERTRVDTSRLPEEWCGGYDIVLFNRINTAGSWGHEQLRDLSIYDPHIEHTQPISRDLGCFEIEWEQTGSVGEELTSVTAILNGFPRR